MELPTSAPRASAGLRNLTTTYLKKLRRRRTCDVRGRDVLGEGFYPALAINPSYDYTKKAQATIAADNTSRVSSISKLRSQRSSRSQATRRTPVMQNGIDILSVRPITAAASPRNQPVTGPSTIAPQHPTTIDLTGERDDEQFYIEQYAGEHDVNKVQIRRRRSRARPNAAPHNHVTSRAYRGRCHCD